MNSIRVLNENYLRNVVVECTRLSGIRVLNDFDIQFIKSTDDITPATREELNEFLQIYNNTEEEWLNG